MRFLPLRSGMSATAAAAAAAERKGAGAEEERGRGGRFGEGAGGGGEGGGVVRRAAEAQFGHRERAVDRVGHAGEGQEGGAVALDLLVDPLGVRADAGVSGDVAVAGIVEPDGGL